MKAFQQELEPVALPGQTLRLLPQEALRRVESVEPLPQLGPFDFGAVTAGNSLTDREVAQIEMRDAALAQVRVHPISPVEVEVAQTGQQMFRYETAQERGYLGASTPAHLTTLFVLEDDTAFVTIRNDNSYDLQRTRLAFTGFKLLLEPGELDEARVDEQPIAVPVQQLEKSTQRRSGSTTQSAADPRGGV